MNAYTSKIQKNSMPVMGPQRRSVATPFSPKQHAGKSSFQAVDNRPEAATQRKFQEMANDSLQVKRLGATQTLMNGSAQIKQAFALGPGAEHSSAPIQLAGNNQKRTFDEAFSDNPNKYKGAKRLKSSSERNSRRKARPKKQRSIYSSQQKLNYAQSGKINFAGIKGHFKKGIFNNQPFLDIFKEDYGLKKKPKTDYDSIVTELEKYGNAPELAKIMLDSIYEEKPLPDKLDPNTKANTALLVMLTQFIEAHVTRHGSMDKFARLLLNKIANNKTSFKRAFNRKDGIYVVARNKKVSKSAGGQEAGRALLGKPPLKSDKISFDDVWNSTIDQMAAEMSESSDEEMSESGSESDD